MEERIDRVQRLAKVWWQSRAEGRKSQEYMALALGISKKTVQNWEKGISAPDLFQGAEWFRVLGLNPLHYYMSFLYPDIAGESETEDTTSGTGESLHSLIDSLSGDAQKELLYILTGAHGSSQHALLELMTAYCHISLSSRVTIARMILEQYQMAAANDAIVCPAGKKPVVSALEAAVDTAKQAVCEGKTQYSMELN